MKHATNIDSESVEKIAEKLGNLRYDALCNFLIALSAKCLKDSVADKERGRNKLAKSLESAGLSIFTAADSIDKAWKICKPFMEIK